LFALSATGFGLGGHRETLAPRERAGNIPLVTVNWLKALGSGFQLSPLGFSGAYHGRQAGANASVAVMVSLGLRAAPEA
jgi:hypothetical protein